MQDATVPAAFGDQRLRVLRVAQQHDRGVEVRAAAFIGHVAQRVEQLGDVRPRVAVAAGVARRVQAGRAAECVHAQAGVVGQRRQPGRARGVARLAQGVLDEAQAGFLCVADAELALHDAVDAGVAEQLPEFGELAGVAAGHHDAGHAGFLFDPRYDAMPSASRCAANSRAQPASARASSASSSSRRKAWPSAVPCSSMKPPPSFITPFMSVSQSLSSA